MFDHETAKKWLLERQKALMLRINKIKEDRTKTNNADWSEQAQERENDEVIDKLGNDAEKELNQVANALTRLEDNTYGNCTVCNKPIPEKRLELMPYTNTCIDCASQYE